MRKAEAEFAHDGEDAPASFLLEIAPISARPTAILRKTALFFLSDARREKKFFIFSEKVYKSS